MEICVLGGYIHCASYTLNTGFVAMEMYVLRGNPHCTPYTINTRFVTLEMDVLGGGGEGEEGGGE